MGSETVARHVGTPLWTDRRRGNPVFETGLVLPRKGAIRKLVRRSVMTSAGRAADIARAPDRAVLLQAVLPEAAARGGNILFVGTRAYTASYPAILEARGGTCWTIDNDPAAGPYGSAGRHVTGSVLDLEPLMPTRRFRTILLLGVLGFGVNRLSHQVAAVAACAKALEPGGVLVLSWNDRRVPGAVLEEAAARWFDYRPFGDIPPRIWVHGCDQNFAFLRRSVDR